MPTPDTDTRPTARASAARVREAVTMGVFIALFIALLFLCGMLMGRCPSSWWPSRSSWGSWAA